MAQYGPILKTAKAEEFTMHIFEVSRKEKLEGRKGIPVCAWGEAGIGKTELPNNLVKKFPDFFQGNVVYLPMAQIEEKAELQGLPDLKSLIRDFIEGEDENKITGTVEEIEYNKYSVNPDGTVKVNEKGLPIYSIEKKKVVVDTRTIYATPSWIPQVSTHGEFGLLVIDDMNRADSRIINSIMQLLQDGKLLGWSLPDGWEIYCTCNPDNNKYQVTTLDGAQMTRMANFEQHFDVLSWATDWATPTGLHPLVINYGLTYPEGLVMGERTNPRSFDKFFRLSHKYFNDPENYIQEIRSLGLMNVEEEALGSFISYITSGFGKLPNVEDILDGKCDLDELQKKLTVNGTLRIDILNSISCRLIIHLNSNVITEKQIPNYRKWLKHKMLPGEIRYKDAKIAVTNQFEIGDAELSKILFSR